MMLRVDSSLPLPVYEQIREQVVRMVTAGTLSPGTRMPTIRQLASDLGLAKGTVAKAYALLEEAEVLVTRGHRGSFVRSPPAGGSTIDHESHATLAENYVVATKQLGVDLESAVAEVERAWKRF
jgi:GntR family transcriptional regulator